jgi:hypothetical protein
LLSAELSEGEGYCKERLAKGRAELVRVWHMRSATLKPEFPHTDLLGAMLVAAHYFGESPEKDRKWLVIFSDMRQSTRVLDFEHKLPQAQNALRQAARQGLMTDLRGVEVLPWGSTRAGVARLLAKSAGSLDSVFRRRGSSTGRLFDSSRRAKISLGNMRVQTVLAK